MERGIYLGLSISSDCCTDGRKIGGRQTTNCSLSSKVLYQEMQVSSSLGRGCSVQPSFMNDLSPSLGMQHHTVGVATSNLISAALYLNANRVHQVSGLESPY